MYNNTVSRIGTHFLRATELIEEARKTFDVPSENWPIVTEHKFGDPVHDDYYAEVWADGMDWQHSYWLIEKIGYGDPSILPMIIFEDTDGLKSYVFRELIECIMTRRRDKFWIKGDNDRGDVYTDMVDPFINELFIPSGRRDMGVYEMEHASQPRVEFLIHKDLFYKNPHELRNLQTNGIRIETEYPKNGIKI